MWNPFATKSSSVDQQKQWLTVTLNLEGLHCTSCALNIDGALEELPGVKDARTDYARSQTKIEYDSQQVNLEALQAAISEAGYSSSVKKL